MAGSSPQHPVPRRALVTGATGQDGSYLSELLLEKGYEVVGTSRDPEGPAGRELLQLLSTVRESRRRFRLRALDLADARQVERLVNDFQPHEIYNLASQSHVGQSFTAPFETLEANASGTLALLESARRLLPRMSVRIYQASSSEMYGAAAQYPQNETTPFHPRSPYACAKVCAFHLCVLYRESYGLFVSNGILFNHESPRRDDGYVTRKITRAAARIAAGLDQELTLGNLDVGRDWGYARDYVDAMWRMLQYDHPDDFCVATNEWRRLDEFLDAAFSRVGLRWQDYVRIDPALCRPAEVTRLQGDFSKAERLLGWRPTTPFADLVGMMVDADVAAISESKVACTR
jgi:GDPmannose 4,6-dehydratase